MQSSGLNLTLRIGPLCSFEIYSGLSAYLSSQSLVEQSSDPLNNMFPSGLIAIAFICLL